ncbi:arginyl-tRNA synthetase [Thalassoporum mexicanum PCC 7367]|uniref:arginine--tRNA ligase n=1 Tax=Thalassoporum mexicanum TaxID=3457544 RepID=UPI00029FFC57|nr:arginine--tRNA ligase [Pseudanabaena sp. PCC 7367]AFY71468.1 arginyl-tRNA synthetase [Pseudanabaena sp. PCC 7367]
MSNSLLSEFKTRFKAALVRAFGEEFAEYDPAVMAAKDLRFGDYQCNAALGLAKQLKRKPRDIATEIVAHLQIDDIGEPASIDGPGFINVRLKTSYLETQLTTIQPDDRLGITKLDRPERIIVDFSSPNIAKEMHVGHLRSTIIGDCIARILEFQGHDVLRLNHVGDWGTQFGMLITYLKTAYPDALNQADVLALGDLVEFYKAAKKKFDEDPEFKETARQAVVGLQSGDEEARLAWKLLCEQSRREFQKIYDALDIKLQERGESFYNSLLPDVVQDLTQAGLVEENDGALCVFLEGFTNKAGDPLPLIVQKSNGGYNYATTDLAALRYRINQDQVDRIIYVTDAGQSDHFAQVFQVANRAGWLPESVKITHVPFGLVLGEDGKKLKTRSGETVKLKELLQEAIARANADLDARDPDYDADYQKEVATTIGLDAVKYADLAQNRTSNYAFSYDKMLALQGNTAPYLLYAYVRVRGISRKGDIDFEQFNHASEQTEPRSIQLTEATEINLAKHLVQLAETIEAVADELMPNRLCQYLFELSQKFNQFYDQCPVLQGSEQERFSRLSLCNITAKTLKLGLNLLGLKVLERM